RCHALTEAYHMVTHGTEFKIRRDGRSCTTAQQVTRFADFHDPCRTFVKYAIG
ncbi:uncharacterized protein FOMMEDRAFT_24479, partial [Fomitiporia mediterranea MF3/22]